MAFFTGRKRDHLRAVDLEAVPVSGPPVVVPHRSAGEVVGAKVDDMIRASNRVVDLECELSRARDTLRQHQVEIAEAVQVLGLPPDIAALIGQRKEG